MPETWIAEEGLTGLAEQVDTIADDLAGARTSLARSAPGDLGWLSARYGPVVDQCVDALQTASAAASESAAKITHCDDLYQQTDGNVELWFKGLPG